ncbi:MAG TPA: menaquinone biosynthesis decarboxylase [Clostridiales bacterium]|nr:menaquinone biosynthesis decarboxylase [Clostridiales bacterium]
MAYKDLQAFIKKLEDRHLLRRVGVEVNRTLEITEIADRVMKQEGPAILFEKVKDSPYPLLINAFGSWERIKLAFELTSLDDVGKRMEDLLDMSHYTSWPARFAALPELTPLLRIFPKKVKHGPCQEVIEKEPDLTALPVLQCWPEDGGPFVTLPLVFTKDPEDGTQNVGMYRLQVFDRNTTGMHWHIHKDGRRIYEKYKARGNRMPVSVVLGADPTTIYAATAPLPKFVDELLFAGFLRNAPVETVRCVTNDIRVPAHAEFVLEGYVEMDETRREGPFGDHTGYYSLADDYPVFHVTCVTHKKYPVYPCTIVGRPPMEDCYLAKATERFFLPLLRMIYPEVVDISFPMEGVFHNCVIVSAKKEYPGHSRKIFHGFWGMAQMMYTKMIVLVDETRNPHDYAAVFRDMMEHCDFSHDLVLAEGPLDVLDHSSAHPCYGTKLGVDATTKAKVLPLTSLDKAEAEALAEQLMAKDPNIKGAACYDSALVVALTKDRPKAAKTLVDSLFSSPSCAFARVIVVIDGERNPHDLSLVAWKIFNNIDARRDLFFGDAENGGRIGVDATKKLPLDGHTRPWPNDIVMTDAVKTKVSERWQTYGLD